MRTLTLAQTLALEGFDCEFLCRDLPGNSNEKIKKSGFICHEIESQNLHSERSLLPWIEEKTNSPTKPTILVDHYDIDKEWEVAVRPMFSRVITVDDLASRQFDCDMIINPNFNRNASDYLGLAAVSAVILAGPKYALLRQEFSSRRDESVSRKLKNNACRRVLMVFGGGNTAAFIQQALRAIPQRIIDHMFFDVVVGPAISKPELLITEFCGNRTITFYQDPDSIAELMLNADLAISAAGGTILESCYMGLPSIVTSIAGNQDAILNWLLAEQLCMHFSLQQPSSLGKCLDACLENPVGLKALSDRLSAFVDGRGRQRVTAEIKALLSSEAGV